MAQNGEPNHTRRRRGVLCDAGNQIECREVWRPGGCNRERTVAGMMTPAYTWPYEGE